MIQKIINIKNLGIFVDHDDSPEFKKRSLIYGLNGSGKTTLTRFLGALGDPDVIKEGFPDLLYSIRVCDEGNESLVSGGRAYQQRSIVVFNKDFVNKNAPSLDDPENPTTHISTLGQENRELSQKIKLAKQELELKKKDLRELAVAIEKKETNVDNIFKDTAKSIKDTLRHDDTYDKRDTKTRFDGLQGETRKLTAQQRKEQLNIVSQEAKAEILPLESLINQDLVDKLNENITAVLDDSIDRVSIQLYDDNTTYYEWAEQGHHLHRDGANCLFCGQKIPRQRWLDLSRYFNSAYEDLVAKVNELEREATELHEHVKTLNPPATSGVYTHLCGRYKKSLNSFRVAQRQLTGQLSKSVKSLNNKLLKLSQPLPNDLQIAPQTFINCLADLNSVVGEHNRHSLSTGEAKTAAIKELEQHYVSVVAPRIRQLNSEIETGTAGIDNLSNEIKTMEGEIEENEIKILNTLKPCQELNLKIASLLGHQEIQLSNEAGGYFIQRMGYPARDLSEGEKTAISFAYFLVMLSESRDFDKGGTIVVVDDPISSLDSSLAFMVEAAIEVELKSVHQLILLTHNHDLFMKVKRWFSRLDKDKNKTEATTALLMVEALYESDLQKRNAKLTAIDPLLEKFDSEYQYLFSKLLQLNESDDPAHLKDLEMSYPYPNIARKVLECYLAFRAPGCTSLESGLNLLPTGEKGGITKGDIRAISNFVNAKSHLNALTGAFEFDINAAKTIPEYVKKTLDIMKKDDERHYDAMEKSISNTQ